LNGVEIPFVSTLDSIQDQLDHLIEEKAQELLEKREGEKVPASEIKAGECFRKKTGEFVYLRISESSTKTHLKSEGIYGVCFNGNTTKVKPETIVVRCSMEDMQRNQEDQDQWEMAMGCKST
jgi:hypothetical protein